MSPYLNSILGQRFPPLIRSAPVIPLQLQSVVELVGFPRASFRPSVLRSTSALSSNAGGSGQAFSSGVSTFNMEMEAAGRESETATAAFCYTSQSLFYRFGHFVNKSSKWVVGMIVVAVVAWRHDSEMLWAITGSILNAGNSKILKKIFNQNRPHLALGLKADPGMPSSHAQSFGYLGVYAAIGLIKWHGLHNSSVAAATVTLLCAGYL
eukprot:c22555_g1_i1 orf=124-750(+)